MPTLRFILQMCKPVRLPLFIMAATIATVAIIRTAQDYYLKILIDVISQDTGYSLITIAFIFISLQILLVSCWFIFDVFLIPFQKLKTHITRFMTNHILKFDINYFMNMQGGAVSTKIRDAANMTDKVIHSILDNYFFVFIFITSAFFMFFTINWIFAASLLCWTIFSIIFFIFATKRLRVLGVQVAAADATISGKLVDMFTNILTVKLFSGARHEKEHQEQALTTYLDLKKQGIWLFNWLWFGFGVAFVLYMCVVFYALITLFQAGSLTPGDLAFIIIMHYKIIDMLFNMGNSFRDFLTNWTAVKEALKILDLPLRVQDKEKAYTLPTPKGDITFHNVAFSYPNVAPLFSQKNIKVKAGEKIGLVGYSGAGKSTFINLILRLYDVSSGNVQIDNHNIAEVTQDSLRSHIAMIPQDPTLFHRTIYDNIGYGRKEASKEEIIEAARKAHAHDFIIQLPEGYNSFVGERGVKLSGGQRQRIAIARAFLKQAPLLMLDEATSQLDSLTETLIQDSLWQLMQDKTTLVIAHRLSTLLRMDRILVFEQGQIVEDGTHEELLRKGSHYKKLWDAQVGGFLPE